jgi:hypothetical protein
VKAEDRGKGDKERVGTKFWYANLNGRDLFGDLEDDERIILKWE